MKLQRIMSSYWHCPCLMFPDGVYRLSIIVEDMVDGNEIENMSGGVGDQTVQLQKGQKSKDMEIEGAAIPVVTVVQSIQVGKDESLSNVKGSDFVSSQVEKMVVDGKGSEIAQETNKVAAVTTLVAGGEDESGKQGSVKETEATPQVTEKMADSEKPETFTFQADAVRPEMDPVVGAEKMNRGSKVLLRKRRLHHRLPRKWRIARNHKP